MDNPLRFVHITDSHIGPSADYVLRGCNTYAALQALVTHLNNDLPFTPDFILHTGDVTYDPDPVAYPVAQSLLCQLKYPIYYVRGNHDDPDAMRQTLPNLPAGTGRLDYDFTVRGFHFIVLDAFGHVQPAGYLEDYQLAWLQKTCQTSTARSLVIALHHLPVETGVGWYDAEMAIENHDALFATLKAFQNRVRGLFYGHIHRGSTTLREGMVCSSAAAISMQLHSWPTQTDILTDTATPHGFNVVTLTHDQTWITQHSFVEAS
ncbi:MAG: metallophosphoesterase [Chloroflexi bacterium]|nr:metallophosphoesterase [Chloroflexota bacterium]